MTTAYISNKTGTYDAVNGIFHGANWLCQSFTVPDRFVVKQATMKLARTGNCGVVTVSIRETSAYVPAMDDLCSATIAQSSVVADTTGAEITVTFLSPVVLYPGIIYALVLRAPSGDDSNFAVWCMSDTNAYTKGKFGKSIDSGVTWNVAYGDGNWDTYFEILGDFQLILIGSAFVGRNYGQHLHKREIWKTDVAQYRSNIEQRNQVWETPLRTWSMSFLHLTSAHRLKLEELCNRAHGAFGESCFIDPYDSSTTCTFTQEAMAITALSQTNKTFTVSGEHDEKFREDWTLKVSGSTGNDGVYTVVSASYDTVLLTTTITVSNTLPSTTVDGSIYRLEFPLYKTYYPGELEQYNDEKHCIQPNLVAITVDEVAKTEGTDYYLDDLVGRIIFVDGSIPADGAEISITYSFYFRVRLVSDSFENVRSTDLIWLFDDLNLIEIKCYSEFFVMSPEVGGAPPA